MSSETAKKVVRPVGKRQVFMDFAPKNRAAQLNAQIAQKKAREEARQRAARRAKMGLPGTKAPGLEDTARVRPVGKTAVAPKTAAKTAAAPRVATRNATKPVAKAVARPVAQQTRVAAAQPEPQRPLSQGRPRTAVKPVVRPVAQRTVVTEAQVTDTPQGRLVEQETYEEIDFGVVEDYQGSEKAVATGESTEVAPEVVKVPEKGPNWPFLKSVSVEKRPLSGGRAAPQKKEPMGPPVTVTPAASSIALNAGVAKKGSKLPMIGLILLTVILGVAVGAAVYFAIFQGGGPGDV